MLASRFKHGYLQASAELFGNGATDYGNNFFAIAPPFDLGGDMRHVMAWHALSEFSLFPHVRRFDSVPDLILQVKALSSGTPGSDDVLKT